MSWHISAKGKKKFRDLALDEIVIGHFGAAAVAAATPRDMRTHFQVAVMIYTNPADPEAPAAR